LDAFLVFAIVASFAAFITAHVALAVGLVARNPRARGLVALLVPPLAPYFGIREKMWARSILWGAALVAYVAARVAASFVSG
jgi:hypothetical protein